VGVAGGKAAALEVHRSRHRQIDGCQQLAILGGGVSQAADVLSQRLVVFAGGISVNAGDDRVGGNETGDVVYVTVSVVAGDSRSEPDDFGRAKILVKNLFVCSLLLSGIALLDAAEQAFFSCDQRASTVDVNRSSFVSD